MTPGRFKPRNELVKQRAEILEFIDDKKEKRDRKTFISLITR